MSQASDRAEIFEKCARQPYIWISSAEVMNSTATLVLDRFRQALPEWTSEGTRSSIDLAVSYYPVYLMLAGLALENLLKGLILATNPHLVGEGKIRKWEGSGHDLVGLASHVGLNLAHDERDVLQRLTQFVLWAGKYPMPYHSGQPTPFPISAETYAELSQWNESDPRIIDALFERIRGLLRGLAPSY